MMPTYTVAPDPRGGFGLSGPLLPDTIRYVKDTDAVHYAHHLLRGSGGRILVLDSHGTVIITEHVEGSHIPDGVVGHYPVMPGYSR